MGKILKYSGKSKWLLEQYQDSLLFEKKSEYKCLNFTCYSKKVVKGQAALSNNLSCTIDHDMSSMQNQNAAIDNVQA